MMIIGAIRFSRSIPLGSDIGVVLERQGVLVVFTYEQLAGGKKRERCIPGRRQVPDFPQDLLRADTAVQLGNDGKTIIRRLLDYFGAALIAASLAISPAGANDKRYVGEMHAPVTVAYQGKKIEVFFLKNNRKREIDGHVADGEIYYFQFEPLKSKLHYVWKVEDEEITSVFFYDRDEPGGKQKYMYVLSRSAVSDSSYRGHYYSVMELPLIVRADELKLAFFEKDGQDANLENCFEGVSVESGKVFQCAYKDAAAVKNYLSARGW